MLSLLPLAPRSHESYRNHLREYDLSLHEDESHLSEETKYGELHKLNHARNIEEVDEEKDELIERVMPASEISGDLQSTGEDGAAPERAGGGDKNADKQSLMRPAEDQPIEQVMPASKIMDDDEKKLFKKQLKKLKANDGGAVSCNTGCGRREVKKVQFAKELEQVPTGSPITIESDDTILNTQRVVKGVGITDVRIGRGVVAEEGSKVYIGYIGKLPDGRIFDNSTGGRLYSFVLGSGVVIKGWEIGIKGMRVGGVRDLDIPPALCYGDEQVTGMPADTNWLYNSTNPSPSYHPNC